MTEAHSRHDTPHPQERGGSSFNPTILLIVALCCFTFGLLCILQYYGLLDRNLNTDIRIFSWLSAASFITGTIALLARKSHLTFRSPWAARIVTLALVGLIITPIHSSAFSMSMPQGVWVPVLVALTITSLRWTLFVVVLTAGILSYFHGDSPAFNDPGVLFVSFSILCLLVAFRALYDSGFRAEREQRTKAQYLAFHDPLTALPNRRLLEDRLSEGLKKCARRQSELAVIFIDLDFFGRINDSLGHSAGDTILKNVAKTLQDCVRETDTIARFGGDEFVVIVEDIHSLMVVDRITHMIAERLETPILVEGNTLPISASMGIAIFPNDGANSEALLMHADQALYNAKESGRNRICYSTPELQDGYQRRYRLKNDLASAIELSQLSVLYQPIVSLSSGKTARAEALARWTHPQEGAIGPSVFIPIAEKSGLISEIGDWVFRDAAHNVKSWRDQHCPDFQVSVNRSPVQFHEDGSALPACLRLLDDIDLSPSGIALEITEGVLLNANQLTSQQLSQLRKHGVGLSLDDFGTGYSSLAHLHDYDMDSIKIDQAFVKGLHFGSREYHLCKSIVLMAHELGLDVIAEGVETREQEELLRNLGCDYAQGYYLGRPMSAKALGERLAREVA